MNKRLITYFFIGLGIVFLFYMLMPPYTVNGDSMEPALKNKNRLLTKNSIFFDDSINRFDITIISHNNRTFVKRVIGLPKETIEIKNGKLFVNDKDFTKQYSKVNESAKTQLLLIEDVEKFIVAEDCYFVLGDNLTYSMDSRNGLGLIQESEIIAKPFVSIYPEFKKIN